MTKQYDHISIDGFPFPRDFEEQILGPYVHSVEFRTEDLYCANERLILSGGRLFVQTSNRIEALTDFDDTFKFHAIVVVKMDEDGNFWDGTAEVKQLITERHNFEAKFRGDKIASLFYTGYDTIPNEDGLV